MGHPPPSDDDLHPPNLIFLFSTAPDLCGCCKAEAIHVDPAIIGRVLIRPQELPPEETESDNRIGHGSHLSEWALFGNSYQIRLILFSPRPQRQQGLGAKPCEVQLAFPSLAGAAGG